VIDFDTFLQQFPAVELLPKEDGHHNLRVTRSEVANVTAQLLQQLPIADLSVEDPPIEAVIDQIYEEGSV
jgi:ABC-2 type transport system ATP-binding protein